MQQNCIYIHSQGQTNYILYFRVLPIRKSSLENVTDTISFLHIYSPLPFIFGGNCPFCKLDYFNVSLLTVPVANSIQNYQSTVEKVQSLASFHALRESVSTLQKGIHLRLEVVFSGCRRSPTSRIYHP